MSVTTVEGVVKNGKVVIPKGYSLPESARVFVVVPDDDRPKRIMSPRLADPNKLSELRREVFDIKNDEV
jgi:KaiC/GvpD/RAD55 family RecA-like ATPase